MAMPSTEWVSRHLRLVVALLGLLLLIVAVESLLLYQETVVRRANKARSDALLNTFLRGDTAQVSAGPSVNIRLENVRFKWSSQVYIDAGNMAVRAVPVEHAIVNFDDLESFRLEVQQSVVRIRPDVLGGMFNESIFNYPESRIRELKVSIAKDDHGVRLVELRGNVHVVTWIPFTMYTRLSVDRKTNTMVIDVDHLKILGSLPATKLIHWTPMSLDRLIALPPNRHLLVDGNRIMVKPFGLFPPPRISGSIASVEVDDDAIRIGFAGEAIPAPESSAKNYVYLRGGTSQFGHFRMVDTDVLILDQNPANAFAFSLKHYAELIPKSAVEIHDTHSARITMPDF